jgi:hypothetical protein
LELFAFLRHANNIILGSWNESLADQNVFNLGVTSATSLLDRDVSSIDVCIGTFRMTIALVVLVGVVTGCTRCHSQCCLKLTIATIACNSVHQPAPVCVGWHGWC